ncbi:hypothetical protein ID850_01230 [Xenorhabdus sp. Flor]|uniref:Inner membrane protein yafU n=1 Tax=Xenorhabdus szentirmaii TaxID=290112 RepID=A0AAW3YM64_9GAMM|nr:MULTISPECIES: hypothetical protein [unclassified Xenorhabdus]MBD2799130.1 hypothetical protein [Xenorhabdus sp. M]MBD2813410.1 hypothetical protein [Xenorhabdus sp. Flor]
MKYDPRLKTFVDNDYKYEDHLNFKKQMHEQKYIDLERQLKNNQELIAILTKEEAMEYLNALDHNTYNSWKNGVKKFYTYADPVSSFAGSIYDSIGLARIINDLRTFGVDAQEYIGRNGNKYVRLTGYPGVRNYLNATRYLANNPQIVTFGVGTLGIEHGIAQGARFGIVFSAAYRLIELIFKEEYSLVDLFVNLTMDGAKLAVSLGLASAAKTLIFTPVLVAGGSLMAVAIGVFAVGIIAAGFLYWLDDTYKISETIIKNIKNKKVNSPMPIHPDQIFNAWGRYMRG